MAASIAPGTRLGRYEIVALIDVGGMGEVYRAHDTELGRTVAVKILPAAFANHPDRLRRFELEARAAAALNHPNILAVYDVGDHDGTPYIVSELLEGRTLRACLDAGTLPLRKALEFSIQIAEGLAAAHDKGIVHRDLKPENIFVSRDERLKILDFGLAKLVEAHSVTITAAPQTSAGVVLGTVGYLSPEQASGLPADQRSDIFSIGAVLFEMVTHRRAFSRATAAQTLTAVLENDPLAGLSSGSGPAARLMNIVRCCLEKAPERRFQSARDLALLLAIDLPTESIAASSTAPSNVKRSTIVTVAAASLLLGIVLAGAVFWLTRPSQTAGDSSVAARLTISLPANVASTYGSPVAISPDGSRIVVAMTSTAGHQLFLRSIDREELIPLADTQGAEFPFFSPDGKWIGFWSDRKIRKVATEGGTPIAVADSPIAPFRGADWGDEGILFSPQALGPLFLVNVGSGEVRAATALDANRHETSHRWPQILPGGRAWMFTALRGNTPGNSASVMIQNRATGEARELIAGALYARYLGSRTLLFLRDGQTFVAPFDNERLTLTGPAEPSNESIVTRANSGAVFLSVAANGSAVFIKGGRENDRTLLWVDRNGTKQPVGAPPASYQMPRMSPDGRRVSVSIAGELGDADLWTFDVRTQVRTRDD